jgi:hypothetical protein
MAKITPPRSPDPKCVSCGTPTANTYGGSPMCGSCASVARRVDDSPTTR